MRGEMFGDGYVVPSLSLFLFVAHPSLFPPQFVLDSGIKPDAVSYGRIIETLIPAILRTNTLTTLNLITTYFHKGLTDLSHRNVPTLKIKVATVRSFAVACGSVNSGSSSSNGNNTSSTGLGLSSQELAEARLLWEQQIKVHVMRGTDRYRLVGRLVDEIEGCLYSKII